MLEPISEFRRTDYGDGVFRRHILLRVGPHSAYAALEDEPHAFELHMQHDGKCITDIQATWHRHPTDTCPGSAQMLKNIVGHPLSANPLALAKTADAFSHCTHFFDISSLMVTHCWRVLQAGGGEQSFVYRAEVHDIKEGQQNSYLYCGDKLVLHWRSDDQQQILEPAAFAGRKVLKGLVGWVRDNLDQQTLEYCIMLQKAVFVSVGRMYNLDLFKGQPAQAIGQPVGSCYALRDGREHVSLRTGDRLNYSDSATGMLRFVDAERYNEELRALQR